MPRPHQSPNYQKRASGQADCRIEFGPAANQRIALVDARSNRTTFTLDAAGRQICETNPLGNAVTAAYDAAGRQDLRIDARGNRTTYVRDGVGRVTQRKYPNGTGVTFSYDPVGNRTVMADSTGRYTSTFDALNRPQTVTSPGEHTLTYAWDAVGNRAHLVDPNGGRTTYSYNAVNRLHVLEDPQAGRTSYTFDALNRDVLHTLANTTKVSTIYDAAGRTERVVNLKSDDSVITQRLYQYDTAGNRTRVVDENGDPTTWSYDATNQLLSEATVSGTESFSYDAAGNRLTKDDGTEITSFTYDAANRLKTSEDLSGVTTFAFDADGNQRTQEDPNGDLTTNTWDYENQNTQIELPAGDVVTLSYTGTQQRVGKETDTQTTVFIWDAQNILLEADDLGDTTVQYAYAPQQYGDLVSQRRDSESDYYHFDALGSTAALTDNSEVVTDEYTYGAWGNVTSSSGATENAFQWVGQVGYFCDEETDRTDMRRRQYDTLIGRFLSQDAAQPTANSRYASNAPTQRVDPSGLADAIIHSANPFGRLLLRDSSGQLFVVTLTPDNLVGISDGYLFIEISDTGEVIQFPISGQQQELAIQTYMEDVRQFYTDIAVAANAVPGDGSSLADEYGVCPSHRNAVEDVSITDAIGAVAELLEQVSEAIPVVPQVQPSGSADHRGGFWLEFDQAFEHNVAQFGSEFTRSISTDEFITQVRQQGVIQTLSEIYTDSVDLEAILDGPSITTAEVKQLAQESPGALAGTVVARTLTGWLGDKTIPRGRRAGRTRPLARTRGASGTTDRPPLPPAGTVYIRDPNKRRAGDSCPAPKGTVPKVNPWELNPSHKITKSRGEMEALKKSIRDKGFLHNPNEPVAYVVVNGEKHIVDGHHRVRAAKELAKELGITEIPAVEVKLPYKGYRTVDDLFNWER